MLIPTPSPDRIDGSGFRIAIVAAEYNALYVDGMLTAARGILSQAGAEVELWRVPGAFEIPVVVGTLLRRTGKPPESVICLGVIWQGETDHARQVAGAVTSALMRLQVETGIACVHEVLTVSNEEQARARCLGSEMNRGGEAALTALKMVRLLRSLRGVR
jgi:6,7-dimethyl-8-ribityllumazine synthase